MFCRLHMVAGSRGARYGRPRSRKAGGTANIFTRDSDFIGASTGPPRRVPPGPASASSSDALHSLRLSVCVTLPGLKVPEARQLIQSLFRTFLFPVFSLSPSLAFHLPPMSSFPPSEPTWPSEDESDYSFSSVGGEHLDISNSLYNHPQFFF